MNVMYAFFVIVHVIRLQYAIKPYVGLILTSNGLEIKI